MASFSINVKPLRAVLCFLLFLQLRAAVTAIEFSDGKVLETRPAQREFDYFVLALQWPGTSCSTRSGSCCAANGCCRGADSPKEFTIHGLWPQYNKKGWPSCCSDQSFDENEIATLTEDLQKYWPTYQCGKSSTCSKTKGSFWAHEWEKHGTCAAPLIVGEYDYFLTTITVYSKYNVTKVLEDAGFMGSPDEKYPIENVADAIQEAFHATPKLSCSKGGSVKELWICLDKNFEPRDCESQNSCPNAIRFPSYEAQEFGSAEGAALWMTGAEAI